jgi:hypothetical protein
MWHWSSSMPRCAAHRRIRIGWFSSSSTNSAGRWCARREWPGRWRVSSSGWACRARNRSRPSSSPKSSFPCTRSGIPAALGVGASGPSPLTQSLKGAARASSRCCGRRMHSRQPPRGSWSITPKRRKASVKPPRTTPPWDGTSCSIWPNRRPRRTSMRRPRSPLRSPR